MGSGKNGTAAQRHSGKCRLRRCERRVGVAAAVVTLGMVGGCGRTMVASTLATGYSPADMSSDMRFWHSLPERPAVANDEALHGLIMLDAGEDRMGDYASRVAWAKDKRWVNVDWNEPPERAVQRGGGARAVCQICDSKGGVMMHLLGPTQRYALRELVDLNIMADSSEQQTISGREFLGVITRAQDYMDERK